MASLGVMMMELILMRNRVALRGGGDGVLLQRGALVMP